MRQVYDSSISDRPTVRAAVEQAETLYEAIQYIAETAKDPGLSSALWLLRDGAETLAMTLQMIEEHQALAEISKEDLKVAEDVPFE